MSESADLRFLDTHEWHRLEGGVVTLGVSRFAVDELTDVTYVELPSVGDQFKAGQAVGEIESVKATSDVYTGVGGRIVEINEGTVDDPAVINRDPFGDGWLVKLEMADPSEYDKLIDRKTYAQKYPIDE